MKPAATLGCLFLLASAAAAQVRVEAPPPGGSYAVAEEVRTFLGFVVIDSTSMLDATGKPYDPFYIGRGVEYHSGLYDLLSPAYHEWGRKVSFKTDPASEAVYRQAIQRYPRFPFSYYALALSLRKRGGPGWRAFAEHAQAVFEKTTARPECNIQHRDALKELKADLAQPKP
jgi:hypothetical protein